MAATHLPTRSQAEDKVTKRRSRADLVSFALIAVCLSACQTVPQPQAAMGLVQTSNVAQSDYDPFNQIARNSQKPGPLLLHGGGGGRQAERPEAFFDAVFQFARVFSPQTPHACIVDAAAPDPRPFGTMATPQGTTLIFLGITPDNSAEATRDARVLSAIRDCATFYFAGGDPLRLSVSLLNPDGTDTPALRAIRQRHAEGAAVTGASAGAMAASKTMMCECGAGSSVDALVNGRLKLAAGLRFVTDGLIDAHFLERGLIGRLVEAMKATGELSAIGLGEDTAVLIPGNGRPWVIIGEGGAVTLRRTNLNQPYSQIAVNLLANGDQYDPYNGGVQISPVRPPITPSRVSVENGVSEIFAPGAFHKLMELAAINATGLAVGVSRVPGIQIAVARTPETQVYFSIDLPESRAFSITGLRLGITAPVTRRP